MKEFVVDSLYSEDSFDKFVEGVKEWMKNSVVNVECRLTHYDIVPTMFGMTKEKVIDWCQAKLQKTQDDIDKLTMIPENLTLKSSF